jgi:nicotinamidase-related amidase
MPTVAPAKTGLDALLTPEKSIVILIDHQPFQFANLHSHDPGLIQNNVVGLAKMAKAFNVPTLLTTVLEERGGYLIKALQDVFPDQKPIDRTYINTWEDQRVVDAVTDASGGVTLEAHDMAVRRMVQAGAVPITSMAVAAEWQRDWAREKTVPAMAEVLSAHGGGSGIALAWEMQLLSAVRK